MAKACCFSRLQSTYKFERYALSRNKSKLMSMNASETQTPRKIDKPIGVYIITAFDFIAVGLVPLIAVIWLNRMTEGELSFVVLVTGIGLGVLVMAASVWAWIGDNPARYLLLGLVTISSLLLIINNVALMSSGRVVGENVIKSVGAIIRGLFWIGINWWYFNRRHVVAYYKQNA
ncbi:MAG TPA: hypothetical protein VF708_00955 [Pyrinomonadaceae bacterium]